MDELYYLRKMYTDDQILKMYNDAIPVIKTSAEWQLKYPSIKILDPDGWDRTNFTYSFYEEKITEKEFIKRLFTSTIQSTTVK
jgi:hypothetical protein